MNRSIQKGNKKYTVFKSITGLFEGTNIQSDSIFTSPKYWLSIEKSLSDRLSTYYVKVETENFQGIVFFQLVYFDLGKNLSYRNPSDKGFKLAYKQFFGKLVKSPILILGNLLVSGDFISVFSESISNDLRSEILTEAQLVVKNYLKQNGVSAKFLITKDVLELTEDKQELDLPNHKYYPFDPNMVLPIRENWTDFESYIQDFYPKARKRIKRSLKFGKEVEFVEASVVDIKNYGTVIERLYKEVAKSSGFNIIYLNKEYFYELKCSMPDDFHLYFAKIDGNIVGFYTLFTSNKFADAHFIGLDYSYNKQYHLYMNVLLQLVKNSILYKVDELVMGRTSLEIKSSLGAIPNKQYVGMRNWTILPNWFVFSVIDRIEPQSEWTPRNPFKTNE